jgi:rare lipoprotein A
MVISVPTFRLLFP